MKQDKVVAAILYLVLMVPLVFFYITYKWAHRYNRELAKKMDKFLDWFEGR